MAAYLGSAADAIAYRFSGTCSRCRRGDGLVSTDIEIDMEGEVVICTGCLTDLNNAAGFFTTERAAERLAAAERAIKAAEKRARDAEAVLDKLKSAWGEPQAAKAKATSRASTPSVLQDTK